MLIDKGQILTMLIELGKSHLIPQAKAELPEQVDPQAHAGLLEKFGLDPQQLLVKFATGGISNLLR
jgi:hypothetical protein